MNLRKIFKRKKKKPTVYDAYGKPIMPPLGSRRHPKSRKRKTQHHRFQKPSIFTDKETDEILVKESLKNNESK